MAKAADADFRLFLINRERDPAFRAGTRIKSGSVAFAIAPSNGSPAARSGRSESKKKSRAGALRCSTAGRDAPVDDHALPVGRFLDGISPRPSASLMAARALAFPMLARSAIRASGSEHFPLAWASFRMTASTAMRQCSGAQPHRVGRLPSKQETDDPTQPVGRRVRSSCWCRPLRNSIPCLPWIELCST
jgi:hypothetical protein